MPAPDFVLLTCEHGGNRVPARYAPLFRGARRALAGHRGIDLGALSLARTMARALRCPLLACTVTRLLVDCNRSAGHPRLFSEWTRGLPREERRRIEERFHDRHWRRAAALVEEAIASGRRVLHVGVHTFTPVLCGKVRDVDVGLLYDPARRRERALCHRWQREIESLQLGLRVRRNVPYRGVADGLVTSFRRAFSPARYLGVELEVNQRFPRRGGVGWRRIRKTLAISLVP